MKLQTNTGAEKEVRFLLLCALFVVRHVFRSSQGVSTTRAPLLQDALLVRLTARWGWKL